MSDEEQPPKTQAQLLFEIMRLSNRIYQVRSLLNAPDGNKSRNWSLSCQLVKLKAQHETIRKQLYGPRLEVDNTT